MNDFHRKFGGPWLSVVYMRVHSRMGKRKHSAVKVEVDSNDDQRNEILDVSAIKEEVNDENDEQDNSEPKMKKERKPAEVGGEETAQKRHFVGGLSFLEATSIMKEKPKSGLKLIVEKRHISLPYHLAAKDEMEKAVQHICKMQVNKYRSAIGGVVIAVDLDNIEHATQPLVIDDQLCLHCNVNVPTVLFKPKPQKKYEAVITSISETFMTALIFNLITVNMSVDANVKKALKGIVLEVGDIVSVVCESIKIKRGMCQMNGVFHKILEKGERLKIEEGDLKTSVKSEGAHFNQSTKFVSDDEDE